MCLCLNCRASRVKIHISFVIIFILCGALNKGDFIDISSWYGLGGSLIISYQCVGVFQAIIIICHIYLFTTIKSGSRGMILYFTRIQKIVEEYLLVPVLITSNVIFVDVVISLSFCSTILGTDCVIGTGLSVNESPTQKMRQVLGLCPFVHRMFLSSLAYCKHGCLVWENWDY